MMRHRSLSLVNRICAEIGGVAQQRLPCLLGRWKRTGVLRPLPARHDLNSHIALVVVIKNSRGVLTSVLLKQTFGYGQEPPCADQALGCVSGLDDLSVSRERCQLE